VESAPRRIFRQAERSRFRPYAAQCCGVVRLQDLSFPRRRSKLRQPPYRRLPASIEDFFLFSPETVFWQWPRICRAYRPGNAKPAGPGIAGELKMVGSAGCYMVFDRNQDMLFVELEQPHGTPARSRARSRHLVLKRKKKKKMAPRTSASRCLVAAALVRFSNTTAGRRRAGPASANPVAQSFSPRRPSRRFLATSSARSCPPQITRGAADPSMQRQQVHLESFGFAHRPRPCWPITPATIFRIYRSKDAVSRSQS